MFYLSPGCSAVFLPANDTSLLNPEYLVELTGYLIAPVVVTFTALSLTRFLTWKGRAYLMEAKRRVGSNVARWEFLSLEGTVRNPSSEADTRRQCPNDLETPFQPSEVKYGLARLTGLASVASAVASLCVWQGKMVCIRITFLLMEPELPHGNGLLILFCRISELQSYFPHCSACSW